MSFKTVSEDGQELIDRGQDAGTKMLKNGDLEGRILKMGGWTYCAGIIAQITALILVLVLSLRSTNRSSFQYTTSYATYNTTTGAAIVVLPTTVSNYYSTNFFVLPLIVVIGAICFYFYGLQTWTKIDSESDRNHEGDPTVFTTLNLIRLVSLPVAFATLQYVLLGNKSYSLAILGTAAPIGLVAVTHLVDTIANGVMYPTENLVPDKKALEQVLWFFGVFLGALFATYTLFIGLIIPMNTSLNNSVSRTVFIDALYATTVIEVVFVILTLIVGVVLSLQQLKKDKMPFKSTLRGFHGVGHVSANLHIFILAVWGVVELNDWLVL